LQVRLVSELVAVHHEIERGHADEVLEEHVCCCHCAYLRNIFTHFKKCPWCLSYQKLQILVFKYILRYLLLEHFIFLLLLIDIV
jgi:hypothetical protein